MLYVPNSGQLSFLLHVQHGNIVPGLQQQQTGAGEENVVARRHVQLFGHFVLLCFDRDGMRPFQNGKSARLANYFC